MDSDAWYSRWESARGGERSFRTGSESGSEFKKSAYPQTWRRGLSLVRSESALDLGLLNEEEQGSGRPEAESSERRGKCVHRPGSHHRWQKHQRPDPGCRDPQSPTPVDPGCCRTREYASSWPHYSTRMSQYPGLGKRRAGLALQPALSRQSSARLSEEDVSPACRWQGGDVMGDYVGPETGFSIDVVDARRFKSEIGCLVTIIFDTSDLIV